MTVIDSRASFMALSSIEAAWAMQSLPQLFLFMNEAHVKIPSALASRARSSDGAFSARRAPTSAASSRRLPEIKTKAGASLMHLAVFAADWPAPYAELWTREWVAVHVTFKAVGVNDRLFLGSEGLWSDGAHCRLP
jgi:hypothetical protein